jgi:hypothetical protein
MFRKWTFNEGGSIARHWQDHLYRKLKGYGSARSKPNRLGECMRDGETAARLSGRLEIAAEVSCDR